MLEAVPNVSEGRDPAKLAALREAFSAPARLLDVHTDADHNRSVFTLVGSPDELVETLAAGVERAIGLIDLREHEGAHPRVGAVDVVPLVYLRPEDESLAREAALAVADRIAALGVPVYFYGRLTEDGREPSVLPQRRPGGHRAGPRPGCAASDGGRGARRRPPAAHRLQREPARRGSAGRARHRGARAGERRRLPGPARARPRPSARRALPGEHERHRLAGRAAGRDRGGNRGRGVRRAVSRWRGASSSGSCRPGLRFAQRAPHCASMRSMQGRFSSFGSSKTLDPASPLTEDCAPGTGSLTVVGLPAVGVCAGENIEQGDKAMHGSTRRASRKRVVAAILGLVTLTAITAVLPSSAANRSAGSTTYQGVWQLKSDTAFENAKGKTAIAATELQAFSVNKQNLQATLAAAPASDSDDELVISLPDPNGDFQRFAIRQSEIMAPGLAAKHPDIGTYRGRGLDDPTATIHADISRIGFHASVRSSQGAWYIDPFSYSNQSVYASYYGRDMPKDAGQFVERDAESAELSVDRGYYHAADTVVLTGNGFAENAAISITISDPEGQFGNRTLSAQADELGSFSTGFVADPDGNLETHIVSASDGNASASTSYQVVRDDDPTSDPPTGDVLRLYRHRADHRPRLRRLPRRAGERHPGEGHAHEPREPGLRGRPLDHAPADREHRPPEPEHVGRRDRAERTVRRRGRASRSPRSPGARRRRARASSSGRSSARRTTTSATWLSASRAGASPTSASSAARTRPAGARAFPPRRATSTRSTTWRTKWATSSPATTRSTGTS